ncbi:glycosyltransferase [Laceyella putida]|uniref:Glycosyltransferase n=1 Tax=Laceyella putida TaxID=110101 RepID=A0ABW2RLI7_9BACL
MGLVIYPPTIDWTYMKQRPQQLMSQFAKDGHTVLFFNKHNQPGPVVEKVSDHLYVINHTEYFMKHIYPHYANQPTLYWCSWSKKIPFASLFHSDYVVYDCVDDFPEWDHDEKLYVDMAHAIVCTADKLEQKMRRLCVDKPIEKIPNGCDWDYFNQVARDPNKVMSVQNLPPASGPKIGYIGAWAPWVDESLIQYASQQMPHAQILIVGPVLREEVKFPRDNVFLLGHQNYEALASLLSYIDVCIIPFRINRVTESTNPIKAYEYLAAGKPVVSTNLPEVRKLVPYVRIANSKEEFVSHLLTAYRLKDRDIHKRSAFAQSFSWFNRYLQIRSFLATRFPAFFQVQNTISLHQTNMRSFTLPLQFCTVNSYFTNHNLSKDPVFIGEWKQTEYRCFLQISHRALRHLNKPPRHVYLELDSTAGLENYEITVSSVAQPWVKSALTFSNKPSGDALGTFRLARPFNETYSIDITGIWHRELLSLELSSNQQAVSFVNPRLTFITDS